MKNKDSISRRKLLAVTAAGVAATVGGSSVLAQQRNILPQRRNRPALQFDNASFYDKDGKFDVEKGKDAIITLCRYHGYQVYPKFREQLWVSDYGVGKFTELGLACVIHVNHVAGESSYMMLDIFLLPNQMLPEHWHLKPENVPGCAQKDEGWLIRWGKSYIVGVGEANLPPEVVVPKCHMDGTVTVHHCVEANVGDFTPLAEIGTRHWQLAGKQGVILTEVANAHDGPSVRHSDPVCNEAFLKG